MPKMKWKLTGKIRRLGSTTITALPAHATRHRALRGSQGEEALYPGNEGKS